MVDLSNIVEFHIKQGQKTKMKISIEQGSIIYLFHVIRIPVQVIFW